MKRPRVKGAGAPNKPARSSSSDKEGARAQGFAGADAAAAEAKEEEGSKKAGTRGEGVAEGGGGAAVAAAAAEKMEGWEEWPPWWTTWEVVDEQAMSFGSVWSPFWDGEFMGDEAYNALFGDVAWDGDLWNLKDLEKPKG
ncbi:hypothetical protein NL676_037839 [Syzygium grande]|nr:hypothetical protein NL676_037839 [Syzygium grande]